ncbi:sigma-70 family RNA polymerase sigma factor [Thiobacter aerophilum]|uniref:Sigma-70 family RNA polymerase sigma factor n=1 Tax=Thiobacter aerophilum TaxID=3121275 RepID=A0ABV0EGE2_9BURK
MEGLSDSELVNQARTELPYRTGAYETLMRRHGGRIRAVALRFARDPADAEDLTQEVMLKVFFELPRFRGQAAFTTWLWRLTANLCIDHQRRAAVAPAVAAPDDALQGVPDPRDAHAATEARLDADRLLQALPPDDRMLILLRLLVGLDFSEIAQVMALGLSATKMRYSRALEQLRARFGQCPRTQA